MNIRWFVDSIDSPNAILDQSGKHPYISAIISGRIIRPEKVYGKYTYYDVRNELLKTLLGERQFDIEKVIFHDPATIIYWTDDTKTVVKCDGENYDPEKGMSMAIVKKIFGNKGNYYNIFREWLPEGKEDE